MIPVCSPMLAGNEAKYVNDAVSTGWISGSGKYVGDFEKAFAAYCGAKYAVAVCNGTAALHLMLVAAGIGKDDEVIIPSFTMAATAFSICYTGAKPVFVDAHPRTWNMDTTRIEEKITARTKAIMVVHIFGNPCDMDSINSIAAEHNLFVLDDSAEAHGAEYKGRKTGNLAAITAFSFFANKNITTGEGGIVVTNDEGFYDKLRYYKNMCFPLDAPRVYEHANIGFNYRMSNLHAAIGLAQTEKADFYLKLRIKNADTYREKLSAVKGIEFQQDALNSLNAHWMNAILVLNKNKLIEHLKNNGIETRHLFTGMHRQKSLLDYGCDGSGDFSVTEHLTDHGLYLPSGSNLSEKEIHFVCEKVSEVVQ